MALDIPMPDAPGDALLKGLDTGSTLMSRIMNANLERERLRQSGSLLPDQLQELKDKHAAYQLNQNLRQQLMGQGNGTGGVNLDTLKKNPMLRGFFKKEFGYDPLAETPEQKEAAELDLFKKKNDIRVSNRSGDTATNTVLTQNQKASQAIDTILPLMNDLITHPNTIYGRWDINPSKKAAYNAKTGGMIDLLVAAQGLPQVKESVDLVSQQIRRGTGESTDSYIKRLKDFKKDLMARKEKSLSVIKSKKVDTASAVPEEKKTINGIDYVKINGEWHESD